MPSPTRQRTRGALLDAALVTLVVVIPCLAQLSMPLQANDEGLLLLHPDAMARGLLPYRDFATPYGPAGFWVLQGANALFGSSLLVERLVGAVYHVGIALGVWTLLRSGLGRTAGLAAGLTAGLVLLTVPPVALAWFGGVATAVAGLVVVARPSTHVTPRLLAGGALIGLAAGFRPELAALALAALPATRGVRSILSLLGGFVVGLLPLLVAVAQAPAAFLELPLARLAVDSRGDLANVGAGTWLCAAACLAAGVLGLVRWRGLRVGPRTMVIATWVLLPGFAQRPDWVHATFWACLALPLLAALVVAELRPWARRDARGARWLVLIGSSVVIGTVVSAVVVAVIARGAPLTHDGRSILVPRADEALLREVVSAVDASGNAGQTLMVGPQQFGEPALPPIWLEYLFPRWRTPQYFREWIPGITEHRPDILVKDLQQADVLVLADLTEEARTLFPGVPDGPDTATRYVTQHFCVVADLPPYQVLTRAGPGCR